MSASTLIRPVVSEKSALLETKRVYTFLVADDATKTMIRSSVESLYGVQVDAVNVLHTREKFARAQKGGTRRKRRTYRKAYVTLTSESKALDFTALK